MLFKKQNHKKEPFLHFGLIKKDNVNIFQCECSFFASVGSEVCLPSIFRVCTRAVESAKRLTRILYFIMKDFSNNQLIFITITDLQVEYNVTRERTSAVYLAVTTSISYMPFFTA